MRLRRRDKVYTVLADKEVSAWRKDDSLSCWSYHDESGAVYQNNQWMISCQIISGHFVGWHPQFCSTVNAQVWNWVCNHILLVYHPWHHTNWAIEILIAFDHIDDFHSIVEWALRVTFKSLAFLFTGEKAEHIFRKLEHQLQRQFPGTFLWAKICRTTMAQELSRSQLTRFALFPQTLPNVALSSK